MWYCHRIVKHSSATILVAGCTCTLYYHAQAVLHFAPRVLVVRIVYFVSNIGCMYSKSVLFNSVAMGKPVQEMSIVGATIEAKIKQQLSDVKAFKIAPTDTQLINYISGFVKHITSIAITSNNKDKLGSDLQDAFSEFWDFKKNKPLPDVKPTVKKFIEALAYYVDEDVDDCELAYLIQNMQNMRVKQGPVAVEKTDESTKKKQNMRVKQGPVQEEKTDESTTKKRNRRSKKRSHKMENRSMSEEDGKRQPILPEPKDDWKKQPETSDITTTLQPHHRFNHTDKREYFGSKSNAPGIVRGKNTKCWKPMDRPVDMRIMFDGGHKRMTIDAGVRDIVIAPNIFSDFKPGQIHDLLLKEIHECDTPVDQLLNLWHGNETIEGTHYIVNDRKPWKKKCPTFHMVIDRIKKFFKMDINSTRFNWYRDTEEWKPFHHDAAAVKPHMMDTQNFTVGVSFGATREAAFEHARNGTVVSLPHGDGWIYCFARDTNIIWRHGILQEMPKREASRISIIAWGNIEMMEM